MHVGISLSYVLAITEMPSRNILVKIKSTCELSWKLRGLWDLCQNMSFVRCWVWREKRVALYFTELPSSQHLPTTENWWVGHWEGALVWQGLEEKASDAQFPWGEMHYAWPKSEFLKIASFPWKELGERQLPQWLTTSKERIPQSCGLAGRVAPLSAFCFLLWFQALSLNSYGLDIPYHRSADAGTKLTGSGPLLSLVKLLRAYRGSKKGHLRLSQDGWRLAWASSQS